jgi:hypothetical protein
VVLGLDALVGRLEWDGFDGVDAAYHHPVRNGQDQTLWVECGTVEHTFCKVPLANWDPMAVP